MATVHTIQTLHKAGLSNREIARQLGIHRETVARHLAQPEKIPENSKPAKAPTGSDCSPAVQDTADPFAVIEPSASSTALSKTQSDCEPFRERIEDYVQRGLHAQRIHQDLVAEFGPEQTPSYYSVRRFVRKLDGTGELPFRRMETAPGEEAQIDFGTGAPVIAPDGKRRRPWVFRIVLSYSRKAYSESVFRQSTEAFITALENAFHYFGGVPKRLVPDNLKAAVIKADWYDPDINPILRSFADHYGTVIMPTKSYMPRHKGKVERGVDYVKENALKGRTFKSLSDENEFLLHWEKNVADTRIHGTTKRQVGQAFEDHERQALLPLPRDRFPFFQEAKRKVHRDGYVEIAKAYYSVPPEYVGREVWCRWDKRLVRIYSLQWKQLALHTPAEPGRFTTDTKHIPREKVSAVERGADSLLRRLALIGPHTKQWSEAMLQARGVEGVRVLAGLKSLASQYDTAKLEEACRIALTHGAWRLRAVRQLLKRPSCEQKEFDFIEEHPIIRPLSEYSAEALQQFRRERKRP